MLINTVAAVEFRVLWLPVELETLTCDGGGFKELCVWSKLKMLNYFLILCVKCYIMSIIHLLSHPQKANVHIQYQFC